VTSATGMARPRRSTREGRCIGSAVTSYRLRSVTSRARDLARAIASSWHEAHALAGLGRCSAAVGHATQAKILLRQALEIFQRIGAAEAPDLLAELDAFTGPRSGQKAEAPWWRSAAEWPRRNDPDSPPGFRG
jgi:hypothetical protein